MQQTLPKDLFNIVGEFARERDVVELEGVLMRGVLTYVELFGLRPDVRQLRRFVLQKYDFTPHEEMLLVDNYVLEIAVDFATEAYFQ